MKIYLKAFIGKNLGDDLFIDIITKRYPKEKFLIDDRAKYLNNENLIFYKKSKFNKLQRISAHKCFIDRIKKPESKRFLKKNSLYIEKSDIFVGLFYKNEIVQLIGLNRYKGKITINNCCSKLGIQIFGGLSKILEYIYK